MADDKKKGDSKDEAAKKPKPRAKSTEAKSGAAKPRARKPAASKAKAAGESKPTPKAQAKPETEAEAKPARKPAARRRPAAKKPAAEAPKAEKTEAAKKPASRKREAPERPVVRARAKYVRSSARKARLVMDHVRGRSVSDARALLRHTPRGVARDVERLLNSAVANAENNHDLVGDDLYVKEIYADEGPTLRRFRPRAQGRATRIRKRTSHLTVSLSIKE
jgi:ribosomal protein L22